MNLRKKSSFTFSWVLVNKLAVGTPIRNESDVMLLKKRKIKSVLSLCSNEKLTDEYKNFEHKNFELPDHNYGFCPSTSQVVQAVRNIEKLLDIGPVFVHCEASIERSPLICIAWLIIKESISYENAIQYLKEVHPKSNPHIDQLNVLKKLIN